MKKRFIIVSLILLVLVALSSCNRNKKTTEFFDGHFDNPLINNNVGGSNKLSLVESSDEITLENKKIRVVFLKSNGAIKELVNKESKVYLVKNNSSSPIRINKIVDYNEYPVSKIKEFSFTLDDSTVKKINFKFVLGNITIHSTAELEEDSNEIVFRLSYEGNNIEMSDGNITNALYNIEYPIIEGIDKLYSKERDHFISPFAMGYLFDDPIDNFNTDFIGISRTMGLYPSGWEYPMQFQAYYSDGIGGFMFMTRDGGETIKSFTFLGTGKKLRSSIYHYLDDLSSESGEFDYDISISNLIVGDRYEALDKYKEWAVNQKWCTEKGKLIDRDDINKDLYENTALVNFDFPTTGEYPNNTQRQLYNLEKSSINGGKILNVVFGQDRSFINLAKENNDLVTLFEFPSFKSTKSSESEWNTMVKTYKSDQSSVLYTISVGNMFFYECASCSNYRSSLINKEISYFNGYGVTGYYHDVGISAVHPKQCFNTSHIHGTNVNVIPYYVDQMKDVKELAQRNNNGIYGQELLFEQMLPYVDFYQSRSYGDLMTWMESDRVRVLLEKNACKAIPVFDYVYGEYGATRMDGFLTPSSSIGYGYYNVCAYTMLNGGIPEYDFEFYGNGVYLPSLNELSKDRIEYIGKLYDFKEKYGKDYLVYGKMVRSPNVGAGSSTYSYRLDRFEGKTVKEGKVTFDNIVVSSYEFNNKIGIFLANTSRNNITLKFVLDALKDYGISSGKIKITNQAGSTSYSDLSKGRCNISLNIDALDLVLLEVERS